MDCSPPVSLSMGFPRQEYWNSLPFPSLGGAPDPRIKPTSSALAGGFFTTEPPGKPLLILLKFVFVYVIHLFSSHWFIFTAVVVFHWPLILQVILMLMNICVACSLEPLWTIPTWTFVYRSPSTYVQSWFRLPSWERNHRVPESLNLQFD